MSVCCTADVLEKRHCVRMSSFCCHSSAASSPLQLFSASVCFLIVCRSTQFHACMHAQITIVGERYTQTIMAYLLTSFNYKFSFAGQVVAILLGFTVFFGGLAIGALNRPILTMSGQPSGRGMTADARSCRW